MTSSPLLQTKALKATGFFKSASVCAQRAQNEHRSWHVILGQSYGLCVYQGQAL